MLLIKLLITNHRGTECLKFLKDFQNYLKSFKEFLIRAFFKIKPCQQ